MLTGLGPNKQIGPLHDPATVTPRKPGTKPTQPAGDLIKAIAEISKIRIGLPELKATLAFTCNGEVPYDVSTKAEALAHAAGITLDIWSVSRIAQHLDTTPEGQAIRFTFLGKETSLLSKSMLLHAGSLSISSKNQPTDIETIVARDLPLSGTGHVLFSGASGMGKTTLRSMHLRWPEMGKSICGPKDYVIAPLLDLDACSFPAARFASRRFSTASANHSSATSRSCGVKSFVPTGRNQP